MASYTNDSAYSETRMETTKGVWVRSNFKKDEVEIWLDGNFKASWGGTTVTTANVPGMLEHIYRLGLEDGKAQNAKTMRTALGL